LPAIVPTSSPFSVSILTLPLLRLEKQFKKLSSRSRLSLSRHSLLLLAVVSLLFGRSRSGTLRLRDGRPLTGSRGRVALLSRGMGRDLGLLSG